MGVKPAAIAGTSIGALIGAAYAAGMRGRDIRHHAIALAHDRSETVRRLMAARAGKLTDWFSAGWSVATQLDAEKFCAQLLPEPIPADFSVLDIPLIVMATDLHRREETAFSSGKLRPALAASIAFPGLFRPVSIDQRIYIDGGTTEPLPFGPLNGRADIVVAVDVFGAPEPQRVDVPNAWESMFTALLIMGTAIVAAKHRGGPPDLVIRPNVTIFRTLEFYRASAILRAADAIKAEVKERLGPLLG
jgi:NTE family protein